jgi:hypothetical protein
MSELDPVPAAHWLLVPFMALGTWLAKLLIGRHLNTLEALRQGQIHQAELLADIDGRLGVIEGRFTERDFQGNITRPGDSR